MANGEDRGREAGDAIRRVRDQGDTGEDRDDEAVEVQDPAQAGLLGDRQQGRDVSRHDR